MNKANLQKFAEDCEQQAHRCMLTILDCADCQDCSEEELSSMHEQSNAWSKLAVEIRAVMEKL